jgi:RNA 3'-terminal phosphate cyclase (GTP)
MHFLEINGDYLEGGGQILRTSLAFSVVLCKPIKVNNIRVRRPTPGLKPQHLNIIKTLAKICSAKTSGIELKSEEIRFIPSDTCINSHVDINAGTAAGIGLILQSILVVAAFKCKNLSLNIIGGTMGLGQVPVDYYPNVIFPLLKRSGLNAELDILRRGYYPAGGGEISVRIERIKYPKPIDLVRAGSVTRIGGISCASKDLFGSKVAQRQAEAAVRVLREKFSCPIQIKAEYVDTLSVGCEINLYAYTDSGSILGADARGQKGRPAEAVGREAAETLLFEIDSGAACDSHLADNLIPWLALLGGRIKTSQISQHTKTNIWVTEKFFGNIFSIEDNIISAKIQGGLNETF